MTIAKAVVAAILAGLGAALAVWQASGSFDIGAWISIAIATVGTFSGTYWTPNAAQPPTGRHERAKAEPAAIVFDEPGGLFKRSASWVDFPRLPRPYGWRNYETAADPGPRAAAFRRGSGMVRS